MDEEVHLSVLKWYRYHGASLGLAFGVIIPISIVLGRFAVIRPPKERVALLVLHVASSIIALALCGIGTYISSRYFPGNYSDRAKRLHGLTGSIDLAVLVFVAVHAIFKPAKKSKWRQLWIWTHKILSIFLLTFSIFVTIVGILKYHDYTSDNRYLVYVASYCAISFSLAIFYFVLLCISPYTEPPRPSEINEINPENKGEFSDEAWPPNHIIYPNKSDGTNSHNKDDDDDDGNSLPYNEPEALKSLRLRLNEAKASEDRIRQPESV